MATVGLAENPEAPRITLEDVRKDIVGIQYHQFQGTNTTVCCVQLINGHTVVGESHAQPSTIFSKEVGEQEALKDVFNKVFALQVYMLRQRLYCFPK